MSDPLEIHVNRPRPNDLEVPEVHVAERDFAIEIINDGKPAHIHLNLDDELLEVLTMETGNHFVPREDTYRLPVAVDGGTLPVRGKLTVSTGYGAESRFIELRVVEPPEDERVQVDEGLSEPSGRDPPPPLTSRLVGDLSAVVVVILAVIALAAAGLIVASVTTPWIGAVAVTLGLLVVGTVYAFL